jgi:hypothetical protein
MDRQSKQVESVLSANGIKQETARVGAGAVDPAVSVEIGKRFALKPTGATALAGTAAAEHAVVGNKDEVPIFIGDNAHAECTTVVGIG